MLGVDDLRLVLTEYPDHAPKACSRAAFLPVEKTAIL